MFNRYFKVERYCKLVIGKATDLSYAEDLSTSPLPNTSNDIKNSFKQVVLVQNLNIAIKNFSRSFSLDTYQKTSQCWHSKFRKRTNFF